MKERLLTILKQYWGYDEFREGQYEIISSVLAGHDTLALMPTGGGKSLTYQLPTLASDGLCIVITPLIALMKDQVDRLRQRGISAVAIHSGLSHNKIDRELDNCAYGDVKFLYISPERLSTELFRQRARRMNVSLIAVDEAHCISQWGYDFRPSYLNICSLRELHPDTPILALTASATEEVAKDIMKNLDFDMPNVVRCSFERPNISYVVRKTENKDEQLMRIIESVGGSGVVYVRQRLMAEDVSQSLLRQGVSASFYHAGLPAEERAIRQDEWVSGKVKVMVATNAFGMGIDKPDVRFVVHYTMSDSMESYYQEAGRAGRDGQRSYAVLMVAESDYATLGHRLENNFPKLELVKSFYEKICSHLMVAIGDGKGCGYEFNVHEFCRKEKLWPDTVLGVIDLLERNGYLHYVAEAENPARVIFKVSRDDLYKVKLSPTAEEVVLAMLRIYNGLFSQFKAVDEDLIAAFAKLTREQVHGAMRELWRNQIIRYIPANNSPILYFAEERLPVKSLYISPNTYTQRKEQMFNRFQTMINYADNTEKCRSVIIANHFGDMDAQPCGCCDICLAQKRKQNGDNTKERVKQQIVELLKISPLTLREIARKIHARTEAITEVLDAMYVAGEVKVEGYTSIYSLTEGR